MTVASLRPLITVLALLPTAACFGTLGSIASAGGEGAQRENYFSHVEPVGAALDQSGLVVGAISLNQVGSTFSIRRVADGQIVPVKVAYVRKETRKLGPIGLAILPKARRVEVRELRDVYAGAYPPSESRRKGMAPELVSGGAALGSLLGGTGDVAARAVTYGALFPRGWFVVALPPGEYQIVNAEGRFAQSSSSRDIAGGTTTVSSKTTDYYWNEGPRFSVAAGTATDIGVHAVVGTGSSATVSRSFDSPTARRLVGRELGRLGRPTDGMPLVTASGG